MTCGGATRSRSSAASALPTTSARCPSATTQSSKTRPRSTLVLDDEHVQDERGRRAACSQLRPAHRAGSCTSGRSAAPRSARSPRSGRRWRGRRRGRRASSGSTAAAARGWPPAARRPSASGVTVGSRRLASQQVDLGRLHAEHLARVERVAAELEGGGLGRRSRRSSSRPASSRPVVVPEAEVGRDPHRRALEVEHLGPVLDRPVLGRRLADRRPAAGSRKKFRRQVDDVAAQRLPHLGLEVDARTRARRAPPSSGLSR